MACQFDGGVHGTVPRFTVAGSIHSAFDPLISLRDSSAPGLLSLNEPGMMRGVRSPVTMLSVTRASPVKSTFRYGSARQQLPAV